MEASRTVKANKIMKTNRVVKISDDETQQDGKEGNGQDNQNLDSLNESSGEQAGNEVNKQYSEQYLQEIEQALKALEKQEEDSLKNNQGIRSSGKEDKYDW